MSNKGYAAASELIGAIFGWAWIAGIVIWLYYLIAWIRGTRPWYYFAIAFAASGVCKMLAREYRKQTVELLHQDRDERGDKGDTSLESLLADLRREGLRATKGMNVADIKKIMEWSKTVVQQYGAVMERYAEVINDIRVLPHPKEDIKLAIRLALVGFASGQDPRMTETLKAAYIKIGSFQEIDPADLKALNFHSSSGLGQSLKDMPKTVEDVTAEDMQKMKDIGRLFIDSSPAFRKYMTKTHEEAETLLSEINQYAEILKQGAEEIQKAESH